MLVNQHGVGGGGLLTGTATMRPTSFGGTMILQTKTTHNLTFQVKEFVGQEGGMDEDEFGSPVADLALAVRNIELARIAKPDSDWLIVCRVITTVS